MTFVVVVVVVVVPRRVTVLGRENHLGAERIQVYSAWANPPWVDEMSTQQKPGSKQARDVIH